jgi:beta-phosphoglucomutase
MIKAVIFDMDGVLIDAKEWHYEALNRALRHIGMDISRVDHLTTFDGLPTRRKLEMLGVTQNLPAELHPFINELKQIYTMELIHTCCKPRFVHEYALSQLKARGLKLGVASNSIRASVSAMMEKAHLSQYLDVMLSAEDVKRSKPDPDIYLSAMKRLDVAPEEALIVEDNEHGIRAAMASGGHLMVVREVDDVNLSAIDERIKQIEEVSA